MPSSTAPPPPSNAGAELAVGRGPVLDGRALNRALLARQLLLQRSTLTATQVIEHLVGMQAQAPLPPYYGLWTRLEEFRPDDLADLILTRKVVRVLLMRGTIHLVSADDCLRLRPVVQPLLDRVARAGPFAAGIKGLDLEELVGAGRALLEEQPRTTKDLGLALQQRWPDREAGALAHAIRLMVAQVQLPPRGIWGKGGRTTCTTVESWLGRPLPTGTAATAPDDLVVRYLAAFGPATVADVRTWSGLTGLGSVMERLRPRLVTFTGENGAELFDIADGPRPDPDTPAPVRFIAEFDNVLLAHADRSRIISDDHRKLMSTVNGQIPGAVLVDGFVCAMWKLQRANDSVTLTIEPFRSLSKRERSAVADEGGRLLAFAAAETSQRRVDILDRP
jgi:hypothetical protein